MKMFEGDTVCRAVLYPRCAKNGSFDEAALLQFGDVYRDGKMYALSLASRFLLKDEDGAHGYGRRAAGVANGIFAEKHGAEPVGEDRVHYLGFYDIEYGPLSRVSLEHYHSELTWKVEHGEQAHFQLEWVLTSDLPPGNKTEKVLRKDRSAARTIISFLLSGPVRDPEVDSDLLPFDLPNLPRPLAA